MPCYHPLLRVIAGIGNDGKSQGMVVPFPENLRPGIDPHVIAPDRLAPKRFVPCGSERGFPYQVIPCGKCVGCRMEYSRQWANRCMLELEYHDSAYFVTLTYDDYHVRRSYHEDHTGS